MQSIPVLTIDDLIDQIKQYRTQLQNTVNAIEQIKGAIASCEHQLQLLVNKKNESVLKQAEEGAEPSSSDCVEQGQQEQQQEEQVA